MKKLKTIWKDFLHQRREEKMYLLSLSPKARSYFQHRQKEKFVSFGASFLLHTLLFFSFMTGFMDGSLFAPAQSQNVAALGEAVVDFQIMDGMISQDLKPVYDPNSTIFIKPLALNPSSELDKLLQSLRKKSTTALSSSRKQGKHSSRRNFSALKNRLKAGIHFGFRKPRVVSNSSRSMQQLWNRVGLQALHSPTAGGYKDFMRVIDKHTFYFRECYEKALLKDEKLKVNASFLLTLNQSRVKKSRVSLMGAGGFAGKRQFSNCLFAQSQKLKFAGNTKNISVKFNLVFGL